MNKIFKFFPVALAAFALASCNSDDLFDNQQVALDDIRANEAFATLDFNNEGITRSGIEVGTGDNAGKYRLLWSTNDKFNLYYMNSLKFNTYTLQSGAGTASGTFAVDEDKNFLADVLPSASSSELYAIMDDSGKGLTHSFFSNEEGKASVSLEIPKHFTQAKEADDAANSICMPAYAKGVEVNANGGVKASFKAMAGLLAIDAGDLPAGTKAVIVVAKGIAGTFEACLEDETPSVKANARYTYDDYIQVDFDAEMATGGARKIYVPIAAGTYKNLYVFAVTTLADDDKDVIKTLTWDANSALTAKTLNTGAVLGNSGNPIAMKSTYDVALGMNNISQPVIAEYDEATLEGLNKLIYAKMDGEHDVHVNVTKALDEFTDLGTSKLYIPTNDGKSTSSISVAFAASTADLSAATLNVVEAEAKTFTSGVPATWQEVAATAESGTQAREVIISVEAAATADYDPAINILAPTSMVTVYNSAAQNWEKPVTAVTATSGLVIDGVENSTFAAVTTTDKNSGSITVENTTVTALTLTANDGALNVNSTITTLNIANIAHSADVTIGKGGVVTNAFNYGATSATDANRNSGNIIYAGGKTTAAVTNYGSGNIVINDLVSTGDIINEAKGGTITVNTTALAANATIAKIQQKAAKDVSITNTTSGKTLTVTNLDIDAACSVSVNNATVGTLDATGAVGKSVPTTLTDATISTVANYAGIGATEIVAYGSAIYAMDDNTNVTIKAYWNGTKNTTMANNGKIFTTGQLAGLQAGTYTIDSRVQFMDLNGADNKQIWTGATVAGALTLDCNNVALQDMNLTNAKFKDTDAGIGLIGKITGTEDVTISNVNLQGVYLETTKTVSDAGILIGSFASTGKLSLDEIIISDVEKFSTKGHNVGGLVGSLLGGANTIAKVNVNLAEIGGAYNVGGLVGYYNGATSLTVGAAAAKKANITVAKYTNTGTYSDPGVEQSALYGTFSNVVGGIENGNVTLTAANITASYDFTKNTDNKWTDLKFYGNYKMNTAGTVKRAYYPGNNFVGFMKTGSATITGAAQVNNWTDWYTY